MTFAVYKGEEFLDEGTVEELAKKFNVKPETVKFWATPTSYKRDKGNRKIAIRLER
ncbi:hypothetical protein [Lactococcus ileimucosae]|uniref:hypothetical protein n=1 Tax=Lactococcus ileimucosae TaxID=2941329 RepID=UPI003519B504